jgi:predicted nucleotidyltransferase
VEKDITDRTLTIDEIKELTIPIVSRFPVKRLILYGSYARNQATPDSDIDLLVDSGDALLGWDLCRLIGILTDILPKPFHCYEKSMVLKNLDLTASIEKDGIVLYET